MISLAGVVKVDKIKSIQDTKSENRNEIMIVEKIHYPRSMRKEINIERKNKLFHDSFKKRDGKNSNGVRPLCPRNKLVDRYLRPHKQYKHHVDRENDKRNI